MDKFLPPDVKPLLQALKSTGVDADELGRRNITEWKDHFNQQAFPAECVKYTYENWEPKNGDILIASFMKTGTTVTREILRLLLYSDKPDELEMSKDMAFSLIYLECSGADNYKIMDSLPIDRRYFASHLPPQVLNLEKFNAKGVKIILLIRNPKDQYVSFRNHMRGCPYKVKKINGDCISEDNKEFFNETLRGENGIGLMEGDWYFEYLNKWFEVMKINGNILPVVYEDIMQNPAREIRRLANHITVEVDDAKVDMIVNKTSINFMKHSKESDGFDKETRDVFELVRKGGYGGWKGQLTVAESEAIDEAVKTRLKCDVKFTYE